MSGLIELTGPSVEPISRLDARDHLRLDEDLDDAQVRSYITAARIWAENYTGRAFINRTMRQYLDGAIGANDPAWEGTITGPQTLKLSKYIEVAKSPLASVTSIIYYDDDDTATTWASSNYYVDTVSDVPRIILRDGGAFPTDLRTFNGLEINFVAGYGASPNDVPEPIRVAILQYMTFLYEHRGDMEGPSMAPPVILKALLDPYKIRRFGATPYSKVMKSGIS